MYPFPLFHFSSVTVFVISWLVVLYFPPAQGPLSIRLFLAASCIHRNSSLEATHLAIAQACSNV